MSTRRQILAAAGLLVLAAAPLVSSRVLRTPGERCGRDGVQLDGLIEIRVAPGADVVLRCCSVRCAEDVLYRLDAPAAVLVVTEPIGTLMPACDVHWVRSSVPASRWSGERIHAFETREEAERHARAHHGVLLEGSDRPFANSP